MPETPDHPRVGCFVIEASKFFYGEQDENGIIAPNEWKDRSQSMGWGLAVGSQARMPLSLLLANSRGLLSLAPGSPPWKPTPLQRCTPG